jgi:hypothetical protein
VGGAAAKGEATLIKNSVEVGFCSSSSSSSMAGKWEVPLPKVSRT